MTRNLSQLCWLTISHSAATFLSESSCHMQMGMYGSPQIHQRPLQTSAALCSSPQTTTFKHKEQLKGDPGNPLDDSHLLSTNKQNAEQPCPALQRSYASVCGPPRGRGCGCTTHQPKHATCTMHTSAHTPHCGAGAKAEWHDGLETESLLLQCPHALKARNSTSKWEFTSDLLCITFTAAIVRHLPCCAP